MIYTEKDIFDGLFFTAAGGDPHVVRHYNDTFWKIYKINTPPDGPHGIWSGSEIAITLNSGAWKQFDPPVNKTTNNSYDIF